MLTESRAGVRNCAGSVAELRNYAQHLGVAQLRVVYFYNVLTFPVVRVFGYLRCVVDRPDHSPAGYELVHYVL